MKRRISALMMATMFFVMTISVSAAPQCPERIVPGEIENNAVIGAEWIEMDTFVPVSTGVGGVKQGKDDVTNMTAVITHVNPVYTKTALKIADKLGANVVSAFHIETPTGITQCGVTFNVKEGYTLPENPVFISLHGKEFGTPVGIRRISDSKIVLILNAADTDFYMLDGGSLDFDTHITYREFFSGEKNQ